MQCGSDLDHMSNFYTGGFFYMSASKQQHCQLTGGPAVQELMCLLVTQGKRPLSYSKANIHSKFCPNFLNQTGDVFGYEFFTLKSLLSWPHAPHFAWHFCLHKQSFVRAKSRICACQSSKPLSTQPVFVPAKILGQMQRLNRGAFGAPSFLTSQSQTHF